MFRTWGSCRRKITISASAGRRNCANRIDLCAMYTELNDTAARQPLRHGITRGAFDDCVETGVIRTPYTSINALLYHVRVAGEGKISSWRDCAFDECSCSVETATKPADKPAEMNPLAVFVLARRCGDYKELHVSHQKHYIYIKIVT